MDRTTDIQAHEIEAPVTDHCCACRICRHTIPKGELAVKMRSQKRWRHHSCSAPVKAPLPALTDQQRREAEEYRLRQRQVSNMTGSDKRRRTGGHGFSGGDGMMDL